MKQMTPEQRAHAIARILAVAEAKLVEAEEVEKQAKVKTVSRLEACREYSRKWRAKCKAERDADPVLREAHLAQRRIKDRAYYHSKKAKQ